MPMKEIMTEAGMAVLEFFVNDTATTEIYTLSLHDALPISAVAGRARRAAAQHAPSRGRPERAGLLRRSELVARTRRSDRKSTRLNSSHANISYAVFCLKKNI